MANYYVKTGGDDTKAGTSDALAWATIGKVESSSFNAGDAVYLNRGDTFTISTDLDWPSSGGAGNVITFGAYGTGAKPVIDCGTRISSWTNEGSNVWSATCTGEPDVVWFDKAGTISWGNVEAAQVDVDAEFDYYWNANVIYVYSTSDPGTAYNEVVVPGASIGIDFNDDYVTVENIEIKYATEGIRIRGGSEHVIIQDCVIHHCDDHGIYIRGDAGTVDSVTLRRNEIYECYTHGIYTQASQAADVITNIIIEQNKIWNCYHNLIDSTNSHAAATFDGIDVRHNLCYEQSAAFTGSWSGIYFQSSSGAAQNGVDNCRIYGNVCYGLGGAGITIVYTVDAYIANNTIYNCDSDGTKANLYFASGDGDCNVTLKNNISAFPNNNDKYAVCFIDADAFVTGDNNLYYQPSGTGGRFAFYAGVYTSLATWKTDMLAAGKDEQNSQLADPLFIDRTGNTLSLQSGSPAINTGETLAATYDDALHPNTAWPSSVTTIDQDSYGAGWEIGAYGYPPPAGGATLSLTLSLSLDFRL